VLGIGSCFIIFVDTLEMFLVAGAWSY